MLTLLLLTWRQMDVLTGFKCWYVPWRCNQGHHASNVPDDTTTKMSAAIRYGRQTWRHSQIPTSGSHGDLCVKHVFLILSCDEKMQKNACVSYRVFKNARYWTSLLWIVGVLAGDRPRLWMLAVGCFHSNANSMALPRYFHCPSTALQ